MKIKITMKKTMKVTMEFEVTENQIEDLKSGENPFYEQMEKKIESGDSDYDYTVNDLNGNEIVPWD